MFETLIRSKIRRTLLAHLMAQPQQRVYVRGLAKDLRTSVSPLHKELRSLEQLGLLRSSLEANVRYYTVNTNSAIFEQLRVALGQPELKTAASTAPLNQPAPRGVSRWAIRVAAISVSLVLGVGMVWWVSYVRRIERQLKAFEGVMAEFLRTNAADEEGKAQRKGLQQFNGTTEASTPTPP